jgi:DNA-binding transcriptional LysR family regulator
MILMVAAGMGVAIVSSSFQQGAPAHVVFAEIDSARHEESVVAVRLREHSNPAAALFFDALQNMPDAKTSEFAEMT